MTCATLFVGQDEAGVFRLLDLSPGGALLEGRCPLAIGEPLIALLHFSPFEVAVAAVMLHHDADDERARFTVKFQGMTPEARACVRTLVREAYAENLAKRSTTKEQS